MLTGWWKILDFVERVLRKLVEKTRQTERDKLENDPVEFFTDHFDGVRDSTVKTDKTDDNTNKK